MSKTKEFRCTTCGDSFATESDLYQHIPELDTLSEVVMNSVYILELLDSCCPGRWEAAKSFAITITELKRRFPDKKFQYVPFNYDRDGALTKLLAIAD